jgi:hypothetical protein
VTIIVDFAERRLARDLGAALRHSDGLCAACDQTWQAHADDELQAHCEELARRKNEAASDRLARLVAIVEAAIMVRAGSVIDEAVAKERSRNIVQMIAAECQP